MSHVVGFIFCLYRFKNFLNPQDDMNESRTPVPEDSVLLIILMVALLFIGLLLVLWKKGLLTNATRTDTRDFERRPLSRKEKREMN